MFHILLLGIAGSSSWPLANLLAKFEPARLALGWLALRKARPEDVPAVMESLAKWRSPSREKRK